MSLTATQIQAQVAAIRRKAREPRHIALQFSGAWSGEDSLEIDGIVHRVQECISELQMREALRTAEQEGLASVLLCTVPMEQLGDDLIGRLTKRRIHPPKVRDMVAELFSVPSGKSQPPVDPRILKNHTLMESLVARVPAGGYAPVTAGLLDLDTAWCALLGTLMGEEVEAPGVMSFLQWSLTKGKLERLDDLQNEERGALLEWLAATRGDVMRFLLPAIKGGKEDLIPIGLLLGVVFAAGKSSDLAHQKARGSLVQFFEGGEIDPESASVWSKAAAQALEGIEDTAPSDRILARLDDLIESSGLAGSAGLSPYSPKGLVDRYTSVGRTLTGALEGASSAVLDDIEGGIVWILDHYLGKSDAARIDRVRMAARLLRWLQAGEAPAEGAGLDELIQHYHGDGSFVDWARHRLRETDENTTVQKAYDEVISAVELRQEGFNRQFADQLQTWMGEDRKHGSFSRIEDLLDDVVAPVAKDHPILLLVLDGMSGAVMREFLDDVLKHGWSEVAKAEVRFPRPALATLPSVTKISRTALFSGELKPGAGGSEEVKFRDNDDLFAASGSSVRPLLFKQGALNDDGQGGLGEKVRKAIADRRGRIVSVVLNAVDDELSGGRQVNMVWNRNTIRGMRDLLSLCAEAGRIVMLTSDHGHVLDYGTKVLAAPASGRGDRWRAADRPADEGEMEFEGARIQAATGQPKVVLPWKESIRYGGIKRGYHGGCCAQELVVPMAILNHASNGGPEGWAEIASFRPAWWSGDRRAEVTKEPAPEPSVAGLDLFEQAKPIDVQEDAPAGSGLIETLLASPVYVQQSGLTPRPANPELVAKLLGGIISRGNTCIKDALVPELGMPAFRINGLIETVARILNIDGYEVLSFDRSSQSLRLDIELLRTQFDLNDN